MKTMLLNKALVFLILVFLCLHTYGQIEEFTRGHSDNDLYVHCYNLANYYDSTTLIYLEENGSKASLKNKTDMLFWGLIAEPIAGYLVAHEVHSIALSTDFGIHFNQFHGYVNYYTVLHEMYGGLVPGEYVTMGDDASVWPYPNTVYHKTSDYGSHYTLVKDSTIQLINGEIGVISGELYQMPIINGHAFLCRSINYCETFDSIPVDTTIINENLDLKFFKLSHGFDPGELFLVTKTNISLYTIHHTTNYGLEWIKMDTLSFESEYQMATAGRAPCSFYFANLFSTQGATYNTLQIYYSSDCGQTFTKFEHLLSPNVDINELSKPTTSHLCLTPNPAIDVTTLSFDLTNIKNVKLIIYNNLGQIIKETYLDQVVIGKNQFKMSLSDLKPGFYTFCILSENTNNVTGKLFIID
jgi:hypothetical protein